MKRAARKAPPPPVAPGTGPAQVVILRHGEKPAGPRDPNLSAAGVPRPDMLATAMPEDFPHPDYLFAAAPGPFSLRRIRA